MGSGQGGAHPEGLSRGLAGPEANVCTMSGLPIPELDECAEELTAQTLNCSERTWLISGAQSVGKSSLLRRIATTAQREGLRPILLTPPHHSLDSAAVGLTQLAAQLANGTPSSSSVEELITSQEMPRSEKQTQVAQWLNQNSERVLLLCDEPHLWSVRESDGDRFNDGVEMLLRLLLDTPGLRRIVTGHLPGPRQPDERLVLKAVFEAQSWLTSDVVWGRLLAGAAATVNDEFQVKLEGFTPLELRLLVALSAMDALPRHRTNVPRRRELAELVWTELDSRGLDNLRQLWSELSKVRGFINEAMLQALKAPEPDTFDGELLRRCLLFAHGTGFVFHGILKLVAQTGASALEDTHTALANYYLDRFKSGLRADVVDLDEHLGNEVEAFYHSALSGQVDTSARAYFAEQLSVLGRYLSFERKDYQAAAAVFERVVAWEPADDYAHHYLAFNLDMQALQPHRVEYHYHKAIELRTDHCWWWSRWLRFLVTRGRSEEAEQAWKDAQDELYLPRPYAPEELYRDLHGELAALLLYRSQLGFARQVLQDVPPALFGRDSFLSACLRRLKELEEVVAGRSVVPLPYLTRNWWSEGPYRLPEQLARGFVLKRWYAARLEEVKSSAVTLRLGEVSCERPERPVIQFADIDSDTFASWQLGGSPPVPGDYLEVGVYEEGEKEQLRLFVRDDVILGEEDEKLLYIVPPPDRYLRAACDPT